MVEEKEGQITKESDMSQAVAAQTLRKIRFSGLPLTELIPLAENRLPTFRPVIPHLGYRLTSSKCKLFGHLLRWHERRGYKGSQMNRKRIGMSCGVEMSEGHPKTQIITAMKPYQRINHWPRTSSLTRKDVIWNNYMVMRADHKEEYNFMPETYVFPREYNKFLAEVPADSESLWISKPINLSRGRGIHVFKRKGYKAEIDGPTVISKYVDNPYLINGFKFDMRIYVVLTSINPLRLYVYNQGLGRFSTERWRRYDANPEGINNNFIHLTNYSVNKENEKFVRSDLAERSGEDASKWLLTDVHKHMAKKGINVDELKESINDLIIKTILTAEAHINIGAQMLIPYRRNCFEMFGFDVLLDEKLNPWLMEVNLSPSMSCDAPIDLNLKSMVISDILNMVQVYNLPGDTQDAQSKRAWRVLSDQGLITKETVQTLLKDMQDEEEGKGEFTRIYPRADSGKYDKYFEQHRPFNHLMIRHLNGEDILTNHGGQEKTVPLKPSQPDSTLFDQHF
ncbi:hypothetical protein PROFUN_12288 [Planoprotostelium fungivorum]|uniref:Tubulin--tyrosine ligase-like protein 5 n=1 Tax=Planoprotostelium fungivorum TaxID=1890364 RepID=A0A2P6N7T0_9EUKA|nr:hypothetical protein PROFUN_12288 [Planoprotostelium fungivorum]